VKRPPTLRSPALQKGPRVLARLREVLALGGTVERRVRLETIVDPGATVRVAAFWLREKRAGNGSTVALVCAASRSCVRVRAESREVVRAVEGVLSSALGSRESAARSGS